MNQNRFKFDKEFQEKLNVVNETARKYFEIKIQYDKALENLDSFLHEQKQNNEQNNKQN